MTTKWRDWVDAQLVALPGASVDVDNDKLAIVDASSNVSKYITPKQMLANSLSYLGTVVGTPRSFQDKAREIYSVKDSGAVGDGVTDDTAAFTAAAVVVGAGGTLYVPAGTYILNDWTRDAQIHLVGAGAPESGNTNGTILKAKAAAAYAMTLRARFSTISNLSFNGNAGAAGGLRIMTNGVSQANDIGLSNVNFTNSLVGCSVANGGAVERVSGTLFDNCHFQDNTTGLLVNSPNAQNQLLISCAFASNATAIRLTAGCIQMIEGVIEHAGGTGVGIVLDGANIGWLRLQNVITEGTTIDIDGSAGWPNATISSGVQLEQCILQGITAAVIAGQVGATLHARLCYFEEDVDFTSTDGLFVDEDCVFGASGSWDPTNSPNYRYRRGRSNHDITGHVGGVTTIWNSINANSGLTTYLGKFGYGTGAGGSATQATNKATAVTIDELTGEITLNAANLNADTTIAFTLNNNRVVATDYVAIKHVRGGTMGAYNVTADAGAGSVTINVRNVTPGNLAEAPVLKFQVNGSAVT